MIITIDGYSWLKKTHTGTRLAQYMGMDFLSTGLLVRLATLEYLKAYDSCISKQDAIMQALDRMKLSDVSDIQDVRLHSEEVEREIKNVVSFPFVFPAIGQKISDWAANKNIVLDGRRSFDWIPNADVCFYFFSSLENRAALVQKVKHIPLPEAIKYILFRDSFEVAVNVPERAIRIDPFDYSNDRLIDIMVQTIKRMTDEN